MPYRQFLMACSALVGMSLLVSGNADAQSASDGDKIQNLERQTELLQKQLKEIKDELARSRKKAAEQQPAQQQRAQQPYEAVAAEVPVAPGPVKAKAAPPVLPSVKVTLGGFLAAETVWRQRNEVTDVGSNFGAIPYPFSPLFNESEFHGSARQSRISVKVEGNIDPYQKLWGYYETDFLGVGNTSNYNQSNSWAPRLRQAFFAYDNSFSGFHFLAGQAWSLLTQNQVGITPLKENIPLTIDASYVVGFNYTRNWQLRFVEQFNDAIAAGVSVEAPATIFAASTATAPLGTGGAITSGGTVVNGLLVNFSNTGGSPFLTGATIATDTAPDIIEKVAWDPGWGHYEVFGVQRFFTDNVFNCSPLPCVVGSTTVLGSASEKTTFGSGIGGSVLIPIIPKFLEFTGNALYGKGVGRYGAGQLADVTIASEGGLNPLTGASGMVGLVAHPWEGLDVYGYAGIEQVNASFFDVGTTLFGYGNPGFSNVGCTVTTSSSFGGTTPANCIANNHRLSDLTAGFWQNVYKGQFGRVAVGAEYEYIKRESFNGVGGTVSTYDNVVFTSLRWYPAY
jgi:hypothetical protein